ncbi:PIG-L family deacetylase [Candidatus Azambacteria bacterium]|nr:PIG-L family deacetylase [Candidatus Azambacteria bacterium]
MSLPRILVVDDEEEYRDGIRWALHEIFENHVLVFEAVDGKEAVDRVKGGGPPFDVIFMDGRMPQMHGLEAIRRIKPFAPETKIIFIPSFVFLYDGDMSETFLFIVAHPDDESLGPGGTIAKYTAAGHRVLIAWLTRGEVGYKGTTLEQPSVELAKTREAEARCAAKALGAEPRFLGFVDGRLAETPREEIVAAIFHLIEDIKPHVVVTMDPASISGHADHRVTVEATAEAFRRSTIPQKLYYQTIRASWLPPERRNLMHISPEELITTELDTTAWREQKIRAIQCHQSQLTEFHDGLIANLLEQSSIKEVFILAEGSRVSRPGKLEDDLLA